MTTQVPLLALAFAMTTQVPSLSASLTAMTTQVPSLSASLILVFAIADRIGQEMLELCVLDVVVVVARWFRMSLEIATERGW